MEYFWALFLSAIGGFFLLSLSMYILKLTWITNGDLHNPRSFTSTFAWDVFWIGTTERMIATVLFINSPRQLPIFIGGWVAAKIAAGWGRRQDAEFSASHFIALIGNAWSFAIAIRSEERRVGKECRL